MAVRALPLARALAARGHAVTVLLPPWQNPEDAGRCWEESGVTVENIALPPRIPVLFHLLVALRLARRALALQPTVVHCFKPKAYSGLAHWLLARLPRRRRPRLVVDSDDWEGAGGWNEIGGYNAIQRTFFAWQERWGLTHADAVTVASRTLEEMTRSLGVPPARVFYVPNGVSQIANHESRIADNSADHRPQTTDHATRNTPHVSRFTPHVSRFTPHVPPPTLLLYTRFFEFPPSRPLELLLRVREKVPGTRLLVVGKGLFGEDEEFLRLALSASPPLRVSPSPRLSLPASPPPRVSASPPLPPADITLTGWLPPEALPAAFAQADLAIYPFDDTLINRAKCPVKLLDLLAAGLPVVAEAVGEIRELIRHGETGWLVAPGDLDGFAEGVVRLLDDPPLRERLGRAAAADVRARRAWERLAETVERAYDR